LKLGSVALKKNNFRGKKKKGKKKKKKQGESSGELLKLRRKSGTGGRKSRKAKGDQ